MPDLKRDLSGFVPVRWSGDKKRALVQALRINFQLFLFLLTNVILVTVHEFINPSRSVDKLHFTRIEGV